MIPKLFLLDVLKGLQMAFEMRFQSQEKTKKQ
jgi:hypothetical protein